MKNISFIINGSKKKHLKVKDMLYNKFSHEYNCSFLITEFAGHAMELATSSVEKGQDFIIAVGGDGTLNEVMNGFMKATKEKREKLSIGLMPLGTGNDFARSIHMHKSVDQLFSLVKANKTKLVDVGQITYQNFKQEIQSRYFTNTVSVGLCAYSAKIFNENLRFLGSKFSYISAVLRSFLTYKHQSFKVSTPELSWQGLITSICAANGKYFGSGLGIAPKALVDDGQLQLVVIEDMHLFHFVKYLPKLKKALEIIHPKIKYYNAASCKIEALEKNQLIEIDGECVGTTPLNINLMSREVNFLCEY